MTTTTDSNLLEPPIPTTPEVLARPVRDAELGGPRSGVRQVIRLAEKQGWTVRATYAKGPYVGVKGQVLRTSESVNVKVYSPAGVQYGVASWVDGSFEFAFWRPKRGGGPGSVSSVSYAEFKTLLKGTAHE